MPDNKGLESEHFKNENKSNAFPKDKIYKNRGNNRERSDRASLMILLFMVSVII
jgi:hypothetical protein